LNGRKASPEEYEGKCMTLNDPIADMLSRIRNASNAHFDMVNIPHSKVKEAIGRVLTKEGFFSNMEVLGEGIRRSIVLTLKYRDNGKSIFSNLEKTSKLGRRKYVSAADIRPNRQGIGVAVISTSKGVMKDVDAKRQGVGGEVLCTVW
jgi:small subunit ribosomal protein S8